MTNDSLEILRRKVDTLQDSMNRWDKDWQHERKDIDEIKLRQAKIDEQNGIIIKRLETLERRLIDRIGDRMDETIKPLEKQTNQLTNEIKKKKLTAIIRTPGFLKKLFRR